MKQRLLITFMLLISGFYGFGQTENFESTAVNAIPTGWNKYQTTTHSQPWRVTNTPIASICQGSNAAFINRVQLSSSANPATTTNPITAEDYLVSNQITIPANGQLKFVSRQGQIGDQSNGSKIFQIKVSTNADPSILSAYTLVQEFTENEMNPTANVCLDKVLDLVAFSGQTVYVAFVKKVTQTSNVIVGDSWFIDDIRFVSKCIAPTLGTATNIAATTATLNWVSTGTNFIIEYNSTSNPGNVTTFIPSSITKTGNNVSTSLTGLTPNTNYDFCIRNVCDTATGNISDCAGPFNFTTFGLGVFCSDPIQVVTPLPYLTTDNTANYKDFFDTVQSATSCGATPLTTNYFAGNDVFYSYTATQTGNISIKLTPTAPNASLFVFPSCPTAPNGTQCVTGVANVTNTVRVINPFPVVAGTSYIIAISSALPTQTFSYTLVIQNEKCLPPTPVTVTSVSTTTATVTWGNPNGDTQWDIVVQSVGGQIPSETTPTGIKVITTTTNPTTITGLDPATTYQIWVRSKCSGIGYGPSDYSSWVGPVIFNTDICDANKKCNYRFTLTSTTSGWGGAIMDIRQNGILVRSLVGSIDFTSGTSKIINVPLCDNVNFDLIWRTAGTIPNNIGITVTNPFGQVLFTKTPSVSTATTTPIFSAIPDCDTAVCTIAPSALTVTNVTTSTAQISWTAIGNLLFNVYVVPFPSTVPTSSTIPTYANVPPGTMTLTGLLADTKYTFYIQVTGSSQCPFGNSPWSTGRDFTTIPTCFKPTNLNVSNQTDTSVQISWTNGSASDTKWELYLVEMPLPTTAVPDPQPPVPFPLATPPTGVTTVGVIKLIDQPSPYILTGLDPAKSYYFYLRTVCSTADSSTWTNPTVFNTTVCSSTGKCNYKFIMTDSGANGWGTTRIRIRQNGITVATLGTQLTGAGPLTVNVSLCPSLPFDVYWSAAGANPEQVGLSIQNPFTDVLYDKPPGQGTPLSILFQHSLNYPVTTNCTPPTCPKPTNIKVVSTTATTATLSWTEVGSATAWEVYAVPTTGAIPPVNGAPLGTSTPPYWQVTTNPATIGPLLPATDYTFWVRAKCSTTDISTWTILNPVNFTTKALNDECAMAINITPSTSMTCTGSITGTTKGGTQSVPVIIGTNCGNSDDDVWYKFVATKDIHVINLTNATGINHSLYSGNCNGLTNLYCSNKNFSVATGLIPGNTYYVNIYTSAVSTVGTFTLCIQTPLDPSATNDSCDSATTALVNTNSICDKLNPGTIKGATGSVNPALAPCTGSADDDVWFKFTATTVKHLFSIRNVVGTTAFLNHAVYKGTNCNNLTFMHCSSPTTMTSSNANFVAGETYYVRVWSNEPDKQLATFNLCIRSESTCQTATPLCAGELGNIPIIYENTTGVRPGAGTVGCLVSTPDPTFHIIKIGQSGNLQFSISQSSSLNFSNPDLDVDFICWGPFSTPNECGSIVIGPCPAGVTCPNNTNNPNAYPFPGGTNIVDCSFDGANTETLRIPNAIAGQYYVLLVTNFEGTPGFIKVEQLNSATSPARTVCCSVDLGPDIKVCSDNVTLNAVSSVDAFYPPDTFKWTFNGVLIPNAVSSTLVATQTGVYTVLSVCSGVNNSVSDTINVVLSSPNAAQSPADYKLCDVVAPINGITTFDLNTLTSQALGTLSATNFDVTYHILEANALADTNAISSTQLATFDNTVPYQQTLYIRVESKLVPNCFKVVPVKLIVNDKPIDLTYPSNVYCISNILISPLADSSIATFTSSPVGLIVDSTTGIINIGLSLPGNYVVVKSVDTINGCIATSSTFNIKLEGVAVPTFSYSSSEYCLNGTNPIPVFTSTAGLITASPTGIVVNSVTGEIDLTNSLPGNYTISNTISSTVCGNVIATAIVKLSSSLGANFSYPQLEYCSNSSPATPTIVSSTGVFTVVPPTGLNVNPTTGIITFAGSQPGIYTIVNSVSGTGGCASVSATTTVQVTPAISVNFNYGGLPICTSSGIISPTYNVIPGPPTSVTPIGAFTISPSGPTIDSVTGAIDVTGATAGVYTITNTILPFGGCSAVSATTQITLVSPVTAGFSYAQPAYCSNALPATPILTGVAGMFSANPTGLAIDTATGLITFTNSQPGVYVISNTVTNSTCPVVVATTTVQVTPAISVNFNYGATAFCIGSGQIQPNYFVVPGPPSGVTPLGNFTSNPALPINPTTGAIDLATATAGVYTITNTIPAFGGCGVVTATTQITLSTKAIASFSYSNSPYCITSSPANPVLTGTAGTFTVNPTTGLNVNATTGQITFAGATAGTYTITNSIAANGGCTAVSASTTVVVNKPVKADFSYPSASYCKATGTANPTFGTDAVAGSFTATPAGLSINPATGAINIGLSAIGNYTITNTISATGGCAGDNKTFTLSIVAPASGTISYSTPMCKSSNNTQPVTISAPTGGTYTSSPAGLSINPTTGLINPSLSLKGDYVITYTVASTNACPIYVTTTSVQIIEVPEFTLTGICQGNLFKISTDVTAQNYSWNGPSGLIPNGTDPKSIVATTAGTYNLTITTSNGCTSKSELIVNSIVCSIQKGISPNGDGKNDTFDLTALGVRHLEIFNRYGTLVYEMDNYTNQWGGNSSAGLELPTGTYFYVIEKKDNSDNITGWIYINR